MSWLQKHGPEPSYIVTLFTKIIYTIAHKTPYR